MVDANAEVLQAGDFNYLAIANPKLAPYGKGAKQVLQHYKLWGSLGAKLVRGENISQAYHFVNSKNAELGFIAYSQIKKPDHKIVGSYYLVPQSIYEPIRQQAVLLTSGKVARDFFTFLKGNTARAIIKSFGYGIEVDAG